jgi:hypothetical protein
MRIDVNLPIECTDRLGKVTDERLRASEMFCTDPIPAEVSKLILSSRSGVICLIMANTWILFIFQIVETILEEPKIKVPFSRDRPPLGPPGSAPNPYVAPGKILSSSRVGYAEPKKANLPIDDSTYHDWDEDDDRCDLDHLSEAERRSRVNSLKKESESDWQDSHYRISAGVDVDSDWLTNNFDEEEPTLI